ncbi:DUF2812 domain-containing protein [Cohnella sp. GCM10020058]|uniref:DUF2812 domain-containing protein n=1 Tax=Cohnella sp. GCM10020058 TaxID=3317330 RepID=UPI00362BB683
MARTEKKRHAWMSWDYEKEERWLNELSAQGLHLTKGGAFSSEFERDETARYTYGLDYQGGLTKKNGKLDEYIELYRDVGWEYVSTTSGIWHYFRRPWEPGETPKLYTDRESLVEHYKKIQRVMAVVLLANLAIVFANFTNIFSRLHGAMRWGVGVPVIFIYASLFALLGYGIAKMNKKIKETGGEKI